MDKLEKAFELFDAFNKQDPGTITWEGVIYPAEYFYAVQLYNWVLKLSPAAGEMLLLASRSQHIGRWKVPRNSYPEGKSAYLRWRTDLAKYHAETAGQLMLQAGYSLEEVKSVQHIIRKEQLRSNPEVQVIENALCLVFLQFQYEDFIFKHDNKKVITIIKKSWTKMTEPGRNAAMTLHFSEKGKALILEALKP